MERTIKDRKNYLRPEVVESLYYLYRATGDEVGLGFRCTPQV